MWRTLSDWIQRISNGWVAGVSLVIFTLFMILVLPAQTSSTEAVIGSSASPDLSFYYSTSDLYQMADSYGEAGREAYIRARFTFDLAWPLVYGFFLSAGISWIFSRAFTPGSRWQFANTLPLLGVLFDYLENISTSFVMARYPSPTVVLDLLAPVFTMLKWVFVGGSFALLLVGVVGGIWRWMRALRNG